MNLSIRRSAALAAAAGVIGMAGSALAATPALAYHLTSSAGGAAVPLGTAWTSKGGSLSFQNSAGSTIATCTGSALSGVTGGSGVSSQLNVTGGSYSGCVVAGSPVYVTVNASASAPWQVVPTGGTASPFTGVVNGVNVTVRCGSTTATPATYSGNLTTGGTEVNATTGSKIVLKKAGSLAKSGSGCPTLPNPARVTQTNTLKTVGGKKVSATNNLWLNNN